MHDRNDKHNPVQCDSLAQEHTECRIQLRLSFGTELKGKFKKIENVFQDPGLSSNKTWPHCTNSSCKCSI